jgi:hypothetical protein
MACRHGKLRRHEIRQQPEGGFGPHHGFIETAGEKMSAGEQAALFGLSDRELIDIGTTRGEIDYVASHRDIDPRGVRSALMDI